MKSENGIDVNFDEAAIIGRRDEQQDSMGNLILTDGYMLHVLADGMGGAAGGALASQTVCNAFIAYFQEQGIENEDHETSLRAALAVANEKLTDLLRDKAELNGMGTTVIVMLYQQSSNQYWFLSVGDSPLYKFEDNAIHRLNENHAYYEDLLKEVKAGNITQEIADEHPQRHAITSAVMGKKIGLVDVNSGVLNERSLLLLASDGVQTLNDLPNGELEELLSARIGLTDKTKSIIERVEKKNNPHQDNTTLILIEPVTGKNTMRAIRDDLPATEVHRKAGLLKEKNKLVLIAIGIGLMLLGGMVAYLLIPKPTTEVIEEDKETTITEEAKPAEAAKPVVAKPAVAKPAAAKPAAAKPAAAKPAAAKPVVAKPAAAKPAAVKPAAVTVKPAAVKPAEAKPVEAKPVEVKPAAVKPAAAKPAAAKPAEAKPAEVKPAEVKPVEAKADIGFINEMASKLFGLGGEL